QFGIVSLLRRGSEKVLNNIATDSRINGRDNVVKNSSKAMGHLVKIGCWPEFNDVKKAEHKEDKKKASRVHFHDKGPCNKHSNDFIKNNPLRIVSRKFNLQILSCRYREDKKGRDNEQ